MNRTFPSTYEFQGMFLDAENIGSLKRYLDGIPPGSFMTAVINNDLRDAVSRADHRNMQIIPAYVAFMVNYFPMGTWGYPGAVEEHLARMQDKPKN